MRYEVGGRILRTIKSFTAGCFKHVHGSTRCLAGVSDVAVVI